MQMLDEPRRQRLGIVATTHHQGFQPEALLHGVFRWQSAVSQNNGARAWGDGRLIRAFKNSIKGEGRQSNRRDVGQQVSVQTATAAPQDPGEGLIRLCQKLTFFFALPNKPTWSLRIGVGERRIKDTQRVCMCKSEHFFYP